jgi:hypothetical protein
MRTSSSLLISSGTAMGLTAIAIAVILLVSNFTVINAQQPQQVTSQTGEIENGTTTAPAVATTFQSTNDSFSVQVPQGWVIQDLNNTGPMLLEETRQGYGVLAQLCPEEQQQQGAAALSNASGGSTNSNASTNTSSCQGAQDVIHIVRYPDLDTRIQAANNGTTTNNSMTTDNILSYHLQKLQEVGYRSIQIVNSTDTTLNVANPQTDETVTTVPAKLVEMTYRIAAPSPNETRAGYFISTATDATAPNLGTTKGYTIFYEGNSTTVAAVQTTTASGSLPPLPPPVGQVFDSFELVAAQEEAQAAETAEGGDDDGDDNGVDDDDGDDNGVDDDDGDDNGVDDDDGDDNGVDDDDGDDNGGDDGNSGIMGRSSRGPSFDLRDYGLGGDIDG